MNELSLENRVALVTGASGGIGQVIAATLSDAGSFIAIGYHNNESGARHALAACGKHSMLVRGDVSDPAECHRITELVIKNFGRIDILVNNAAISFVDSFEMTYETWKAQWNATVNANLMSAVNMTFCSVPFMKRQGSGKIINISSRSAFRGETEYMAYAASKAAMVNFTRCVARIVAKDNVQAYAVAPGFIEAGMALDTIAHHGEEIRSQIPSGKIGTAQDVANVVLFLASGLSNYLTGSTIDVNGGSYLH